MRRHRPILSTRHLAGGGLVEILVVLLLVSLLAAALMTGLMEKNAQLESSADEGARAGTEDLAGLLELWTSDPQDLEARGIEARSLDTSAERDAYQDLVNRLEDRGQLDDWKDMLRKRLGDDHALLVALESDAEAQPEAGPVEIRWAGEAAAAAEADDDGDPDIRWVD